MAKHYTAEQDAIIKEQYPKIGIKVAKLLPDHDEKSIIYRAKRLGCHSSSNSGKGESWTDEEVKILRDNFPKMGTTVVCLLPNRTCHAVANKAQLMGIRAPGNRHIYNKPNNKASKETGWTRAEDRIIIKTCYDYVNNKLKYNDEIIELLPDRNVDEIRLRVANLAKYRNSILGGYPINVYIAITGGHKNYIHIGPRFAELVEAAFTAIRSNSNKPEVAEKIVKALELHYKFGMSIVDVAAELEISDESAKWLLDNGLKFLKQALKK